MRGANAVLDVFKKKDIVSHVKEVGAYLYEKLDELVAEYDLSLPTAVKV